MTKIVLVDGNNLFRRAVEKQRYPLRWLYEKSGSIAEPWVWVWDGPGAAGKRRELYPDYKVGREKPPSQIYEFMDLLRELLKMSPASQIRVPGYEADDVIATLVRTYPTQEFHIESNDRDLSQLVRPGVTVPYDLPTIGVRWIRLWKATVGDTSDRIPGVKGFGARTWEHLSDKAKVQLEEFLAGERNDFPADELPTGVVNWLVENRTIARTYYKIVGLYDVPLDLINEHTVKGTPKPMVVHKILKELMQ